MVYHEHPDHLLAWWDEGVNDLQPTTRRHSWCFVLIFGVLTLSLLCPFVSTANDYSIIVFYIKIFFCCFHFIWGKSETCSVSVAAKKTKKQVYVSYSLPVTDSNISLLVEDRIKKELALHPEHFWTCLFFEPVLSETEDTHVMILPFHHCNYKDTISNHCHIVFFYWHNKLSGLL